MRRHFNNVNDWDSMSMIETHPFQFATHLLACLLFSGGKSGPAAEANSDQAGQPIAGEGFNIGEGPSSGSKERENGHAQGHKVNAIWLSHCIALTWKVFDVQAEDLLGTVN